MALINEVTNYILTKKGTFKLCDSFGIGLKCTIPGKYLV